MGYWMTWFGVAGGLCGVFFALPPFVFGIWVQNEPVTAAVFAAAALTGTGLTVLAAQRRAVAARAMTRPIVVIPLALAGWSALALPFAHFPWLSILGSPEHGEGILGFISIGILAAGALVVRARPWPWRVLLALAVATTALVAVPTISQPRFPTLTPYYFKDFVAFYGLHLMLIGAAFTDRRPRASLLVVLAGAIVVALSENRAAIALTFVAGPLAWLVTRAFLRRHRQERWRPALLVACIPIVIVPLLWITSTIDEGSTVWSRYLLSQIVFEVMQSDPWRLATGIGWGHFGEALIAQAPLEGITFMSAGPGREWDALGRVDFHSHSLLAEALLSAGVVGATLGCLLPASVVASARPALVAAATAYGVVLAGALATWFQYPSSFALMAIAFAAASARRASGAARHLSRRWPLAVIALAATIALAAGAALTARSGIVARAVLERGQSHAPACSGFFPDDGRGGYHLAWTVRSYVRRLGRLDPIPPAALDQLSRFLDATSCQLVLNPSLRLLASDLTFRAELAFAPTLLKLEPLRTRYLTTWGERAAQLIAMAPARTDLVAPYLTWEIESGRENATLAMATRILELAPADPIALWFSGIVRAGEPETMAQGRAEMRRALEKGVERFVFIDPAVLAKLR